MARSSPRPPCAAGALSAPNNRQIPLAMQGRRSIGSAPQLRRATVPHGRRRLETPGAEGPWAAVRTRNLLRRFVIFASAVSNMLVGYSTLDQLDAPPSPPVNKGPLPEAALKRVTVLRSRY